MKNILSLFLIISFISLYAQEESNYKKEVYLTTNISSTTISYAPRWTLGVIIPIKEKWFVGLDVGYGNKKSIIGFSKSTNRVDNEYKLWEIRPQIYYLLTSEVHFKSYISVELFYINHKDVFVNNNELLQEERYIYNNKVFIKYDQANYLRKKYGLNLNYGIIATIWRQLGINFNLGLGIRDRQVSFTNIINPRQFTPDEDRFLPFESENYLTDKGVNIGLNFDFNIKLYLKLNSKKKE